jgi:ectoine hydroxylase-related dioxygenase (phytanoyl-CoA dioxygenase family)
MSEAMVTERVLPTTDLSRAKADYEIHGFCIIADVLSAAELEAVRQRITEQAEAEKALGWAWEDSGPTQAERLYADQLSYQRERATGATGGVNQRVNFLVNKGQVFRDLVTHPVALEMMEYMLGKHFLLSSFSANIAKIGGVEQGLHRDNWWCPIPYRRGEQHLRVGDSRRYLFESEIPAGPSDVIVPPCAANVLWMITDFKEDNGGTRLVPRSHLRTEHPDGSVPHKIPTVATMGKAGSCLVFDGRLWHGTGRCLTEEPRIGLLAFYCGPQFRQFENYFLGLDPAILEAASDRLLDLLGYSTWMSYGFTDERSSRKRLRAREPWIPELKLVHSDGFLRRRN